MSRYIRRPATSAAPRQWIEDDTYGDAPMLPALMVDDHMSVDTGLLWGDGSIVWREPNPIGFGADIE